MNARRKLSSIVNAAITACTDDKGRFDQKLVDEEVARRLTELPDDERAALLAEIAKTATTRVIDRRKPKEHPDSNGQLVLFDDEAIMKLGNNQRVLMGKARHEDMTAWNALMTLNLARVVASAAKHQAYVVSRSVELRAHPEKNLGEIEREFFGYEPPVEGDDDDPDWDGDDDGEAS